MFDERHFPYEYECEGCSKTATVTHEDVQDVPSYFATSTVAEAVAWVARRCPLPCAPAPPRSLTDMLSPSCAACC